MGMSIQSSTASMAQTTSSVSSMQQQQLIQSMQTPAPAAAQEPVSKPVGNVGNNIDVRA
ncbi:MAG: hypothetical protein WC216_02505 [Gallionella sp.]